MPRSPVRYRVVVPLALAGLLAIAWVFLRSASSPPLSSPPVQPPRALSPAPASEVADAHPVPSSGAPLPSAPAAVAAPFSQWLARYLAAPVAERPALETEGLALARARRPRLAELIRTAPAAALAAAVPRSARAALPATILAELEEIVSARAEFAVIQTCFHPPGTVHQPGDDLHRATVIDGREYRLHVYGSRLLDPSLPATSLSGIAVDRDLAIYDTRHRVLAVADLPDGTTAPSPDALAVEADGEITFLPSPDELPAFAAALLSSEANPLLADAGQGSSTVGGRPSQAWTHGTKRVLIIRVDFSDLPGTPINRPLGNSALTEAALDNVLNGAGGVREFIQANSYGKADLNFNPATDVTAVLRMPATASSYATAGANTLLHTDARALATAAGFNLANYDRIGVAFSFLGDLPGSTIKYGGLANLTGANFWSNGNFDLRVIGHELGHNYGLRHANLWQVSDGKPVSLATGASTEYGDPFDLMGDGDFFANHFGAWNKSILQWIPDTAVTTLATSGTYRVYRFDDADANLSAPRALKVVRDSVRDYWIGYRRGLDSTATDNGATVIWGYNFNQQGDLLDLTTPGANSADAPLPLNTSFNDSVAGITLRPVAQGGSGPDEWLDVQVTFLPRLAWSAPSYVVNEQGGSAVLTVTRANNSTGVVSVSYATSATGQDTATPTTDFASTNGTLTWLDGDSAPKTITIPLVADALVEGAESFTVTLSSPVGGAVTEPSTSVTIADPGARDPSFASNFINSSVFRVLPQPDGTVIIGGAFSQLQDSDFQLYSYGRIARFTAEGRIDPDFNPGAGANGTVYALARQPDGKILVGGAFSTYAGTARGGIARLNTDGSLDPAFAAGVGTNGIVYDLLLLPDGKILVAGDFTTYDGVARNSLVRLLPDGTRDITFADFTGPIVFSLAKLALQPDGKILVAGAYYFSTGNLRAGLRRLQADGTFDSSFTGLTSGASDAFDPQFIGNIEEVAVLPSGQILIAGDFSQINGVARPGIARLGATGSLDATFTPSPNARVTALLPLPDGRILLGGSFTSINGTAVSRIARLQSTGALDTAYAAAGGHTSSINDFALLPAGQALFGGGFGNFQGSSSSRPLWRFFPGLAGTPGVVQFATDFVSAVEGLSASLSVTREGGSLGALTVGYATVSGTATAGGDYTTTTGTLAWTDGDASAKTILVPISADASVEAAESFVINLGAPLVGGTLLGERQQLTATLSTAFDAWRAARFTVGELDDPAVSGDHADADGDGLDNLTEFALGREPRLPDAAGATPSAVQTIGDTPYLTLTFRRRAPALDLSYTVQTSGDLAGAWTGNAVLVGAPVVHGDGTETVTYRDSVATTSATRRFLRLQVTRTP